MELALALVFGLVIGSFLNVCIVRLPLGQSISLPRSHCPRCKKPIAFYDNVPVLSYLILGGRCRFCALPISPRYPAVEVATSLISVLIYLKFGIGIEWGVYFALSCSLLVLALIDVEHRILPDVITLNGIWVGIIASVLLGQSDPMVGGVARWAGLEIDNPRILALISSVVGIIVGGGLLWLVREAYLRLRGVEGMGFGDVKMMAMVGAFLGAPLALLTIMLGSLLGSIIGILWIRLSGKTRKYELPFGTFLGIAGIFAVLYGNTLMRLYMERVFPQ